MDFKQLLHKRTSVREYKPDKIPRDVLDGCVEAARLAPSACNCQPWSFIIADDEGIKNELADAAFGGIYSLNAFAKKAPVLVAMITEKSSYAAMMGGFLRGTQYNLIDIGIAGEHFILKATEEGLGTCWIGWFNEKQAKKVLGIPKNSKVDILISVGYPLAEQVSEKERKALDEIRKYNRRNQNENF